MCSAKAAQSEITELFSKFAHSCNFFVPVLAVQWRSGRTDGGVKTCLKRREPLTGKKGISDSGGHHQPKKLLPGRILGKKTCMLQFSLTDNGLSKLATSDYR